MDKKRDLVSSCLDLLEDWVKDAIESKLEFTETLKRALL